MDRSRDITSLAEVRRLHLPSEIPSFEGVPGRLPSLQAYIPVLPQHRALYHEASSMGLLELFPVATSIHPPSIDQACRILMKTFPSPSWQGTWEPKILEPGRFLVPFSSRDALLQAFRVGVKWGRRFSCSIRPWSLREGGSPSLLSYKAAIRLRRLPLMLWDSDSLHRLLSGFASLAEPPPTLDLLHDLSGLQLSVFVRALEDIPEQIFATLGDIRYAIHVDLLDFAVASPPPSQLLLRAEGEPDWGDSSVVPDSPLDDVSDPIEVESDQDDDEDPSEVETDSPPSDTLPLTGVGFSAAMPTLVAAGVSEGYSGLCFTLVTREAITVDLLKLSISPSCLPAPLVAPWRFSYLQLPRFPLPPPSSPACCCHAQLCLHRHLWASSATVLHLRASSVPPVICGSAPSSSASHPAPRTPHPAPPTISPLPPASSSSPPPSLSRPSRPKAVLGVKRAAVKLLSKKKAAALLPLRAVPDNDLVAWGSAAGFVSDSGFVEGIRAMESRLESTPDLTSP